MACYMHDKMQSVNSGKVIVWLFEENEIMHKNYKSHRDTNVIDGAFIEQVMRECICIKEIEIEKPKLYEQGVC